MLHLEAGVDLEKVEVTRISIDKELSRSGGAIVKSGRHLGSAFEEFGRFFASETGRRRFFDNLLVASLSGAVPRPERDDFAFSVSKELDLNMACPFDIIFKEDTGVSEIRLTRPGNPFECFTQTY